MAFVEGDQVVKRSRHIYCKKYLLYFRKGELIVTMFTSLHPPLIVHSCAPYLIPFLRQNLVIREDPQLKRSRSLLPLCNSVCVSRHLRRI